MAIKYRTTDLTRWGAGTGIDLNAVDVDMNFWTLYEMILGITPPTPPVGITGFTVVGASFYVNMTDGSTRGPFALPVGIWNYRGAWQPSTVYAVDDVITNAGASYLVIFAHTSALTFSPTANDGMGHNYYGLLNPAAAGVPVAGTTGQVLAKLSNTDYNTGWVSSGVPTGGTIGQVLTKNSSANYDDAWVTPIGVPAGGTTGQMLAKNSNTSGDAGWYNPPFTQASVIIATPYTLHLSDAWTILQGEGSTLTIPLNASVAFPIGTVIMVINSDAGPTTIVGATGVTLEPGEYTSFILEDYRAVAFLTKIGTDIWLINGQLKLGLDTTAYGGVSSVDFSWQSIVEITPASNTTFNDASAYGVQRKRITFIFITSGTTSYTITFGTNFISQGTLATGVVSGKHFVVDFMGDGTNWYEVSRTAAM